MTRTCMALLPCAAVAVFAAAPVLAQPISYRGFALGISPSVVARATGEALPRAETQNLRAAVTQSITWHPRRPGAEPDSVEAIVFRFHDDRLFTMLVHYGYPQTKGLTDADLVTAVSALFGPVTAATSQHPAPWRTSGLATPYQLGRVVARWTRSDTVIQLYRDDSLSSQVSYALVITSVPLEAAARAAEARADAGDAREGQRRETLRRDAEAGRARDDAARARDANKGAFKP